MAILVGIDEAGFGPILGPLVVSSSTFRVPDNLIWKNLWEVLRTSVSDKRNGLRGRLLIVDSKKAFTRSLGIKHLRRTVLAVLKHLGSEPSRAGELISTLCPDCLEHLAQYPWYKQLDGYPLEGDPPRPLGTGEVSPPALPTADNTDIAIGASMLKADLAGNHIELLGLKSRCLEVAYYNSMVAVVKNKAKVLFSAVAELISDAVTRYKDENLEIIADRQGGRSHYRRELQLMFAGADLKILREDEDVSSYELTLDGRKVRVYFMVGADNKYLPVSLASMACKYLREVLVDNINRYFIGFNSTLRPTAGYWKDGLRFIEDIKTHIPNVSFDTNQLIRCR
jgi:ribonuclease HII